MTRPKKICGRVQRQAEWRRRGESGPTNSRAIHVSKELRCSGRREDQAILRQDVGMNGTAGG